MFDILGDIHSSYAELCAMLIKLGYSDSVRPEGRTLVFTGDYLDRGINPVDTIALVMTMFQNGVAIGVIGNHCDKLKRYLKGNKVTPSHGLADTIAKLEAQGKGFTDNVLAFLEKLPIELSLDSGKLLVSHAGLPSHLQGKTNGTAKSHAMFGDVDGKSKDAQGYPVRKDWAQNYCGNPIVVHGHTPTEQPRCVNNVWAIDQGAVFGGSLTCLRYPEMEIVQVKAARNYTDIQKFGSDTA